MRSKRILKMMEMVLELESFPTKDVFVENL